MSIPALILFKDGVEVDKVIGFQQKEALTELILKHA
jgi:thioredoxin 1